MSKLEQLEAAFRERHDRAKAALNDLRQDRKYANLPALLYLEMEIWEDAADMVRVIRQKP